MQCRNIDFFINCMSGFAHAVQKPRDRPRISGSKREEKLLFKIKKKTKGQRLKQTQTARKVGRCVAMKGACGPVWSNPEKKWLIANLDGQLGLGASASHCGLENR